MDIRTPERPQSPTYGQAQAEPEYRQQAQPSKHRGGKGKKFLMFLLVLILIAAAGAGAYWWRDKNAKDTAKQQAEQINSLQAQLNDVQNDLKSSQESAAKQAANKVGPSEETLTKVENAIKAGKYSDIQSLLASKVSVIIAASEGLGIRTPTQVVSDLKNLDSGTDPWNFELPGATIKNYQDGDYAQYFPTGALVGKSANDHVVSFVFNDSGKVTGVFIAADADLL